MILSLVRKHEANAEAEKLAALTRYRRAVLAGDARKVFELAEAAGVNAVTLRKHAALIDLHNEARRTLARGEPNERKHKAAIETADAELLRLRAATETALKRWTAACDEAAELTRRLEFERFTQRTIAALLPWVDGDIATPEKTPLRDSTNHRVIQALREAEKNG